MTKTAPITLAMIANDGARLGACGSFCVADASLVN